MLPALLVVYRILLLLQVCNLTVQLSLPGTAEDFPAMYECSILMDGMYGRGGRSTEVVL